MAQVGCVNLSLDNVEQPAQDEELEALMSLDWPPSSSPILGGVATGASRPQRPRAAPSNTRSSFDQIAQRVRAEYLEMPGLNLTRDQAKCLWAVDGPLCDRLLAYLVETGFLERTAHATYVHVAG